MSIRSFVRQYALNCYTFIDDKEAYLVAKLIFKYMKGKRILDLGCGPVVPITSVFYPQAKEVIALDLLKENLEFIKQDSILLEGIIKRAKAYRKKFLSKKIINPKVKLIHGDVTKYYKKLGKFDSVMNLGCFGALDTPQQFQLAVNNAYRYLKKGGILLMINWIGDVKRPYHFNGKVDEMKLYIPSMQKAGFKIQQIHTNAKALSPETKRLGYTKIIWAVAKKP